MADKPICKIPDCGKPSKTRGWCNAHHHRFLRWGDPTAGGLPKGEAKRFLDEVALRHTSDDCLIWPYGKTPAGYGVIMLRYKQTYVHVLVCEAKHGPRPEGRYEAAHSCGKSSCCNPKHLRWATPHENALDKRGHGTMPQGSQHHWSTVSDDKAEAILAMKGVECSARVAARFGVPQSYVNSIWAGRIRAHMNSAG